MFAVIEFGSGVVVNVTQDALVPLVVKYLPEFVACAGNASTVDHDAFVPFVVKNLPD
jgi:hypothetical protein